MAPVTGYIVVLYNIYSNYVDITPVVYNHNNHLPIYKYSNHLFLTTIKLI